MGKNGIGLHIVYEENINESKLRERLRRLDPRYINVFGGARIDQAFPFAVSMKQQHQVIFRRWAEALPDDGLHTRITPEEFIRLYEPFLAQGLICLTDNESVTWDMTAYAKWNADIMDMAGARGWRVAVGRTSTGNPGGYGNEHLLPPTDPRYRPDNYSEFKPMWAALARWKGLHIYSPNEYVDKTGYTAGMTARFLEGHKRSVAMGYGVPPTVIGEYGTAYISPEGALDPDAGYKDSRNGLSGAQFANLIITSWEKHYKPHGVDVMVYCYGDSMSRRWSRFDLADDEDFWGVMYAAAESGRLAFKAPPPIEVKPPPVTVTEKPRFGFNITSLNNVEKFMTYARKINPPAVVVYESGLAQRLKHELPQTNVILRNWPDRTLHEEMTPAQWLDRHQHGAAGGIMLYTTNEPAWSQSLLDWHLELAKLAVQRGIRLCMLNLSVGIPDSWVGAEALLRYCSEHRDLLAIGLHEYAGGVITSGLGGGIPTLIQPDQWPRGEALKAMKKYHMGRWQMLRDFCQARSIPLPRIIVTECGMDATGDIDAWLKTLKVYGGSANGWKSMEPQWKEWWPQWTKEQAYLNQLRYAQTELYPGVESLILFVYEDEQEWVYYNVNEEPFMTLIQNQSPNPVTPGNYTITPSGDWVNFREQPGMTAKVIGRLGRGTVVEALEESEIAGRWWQKVKANGVTGWICKWWEASGVINRVEFQLHSTTPIQRVLVINLNVPVDDEPKIIEALKVLGLTAKVEERQ